MAASCATAHDRRGDHRDGGLALRRLRAVDCSSFSSTAASPPRTPLSAASIDDRIVAVPFEHRRDRRLARSGRQRAERRRQLLAHRPVRVVEPLQHRRLNRMIRLRPAIAPRAGSPTTRTSRDGSSSAFVDQVAVRCRRGRRASTARAGASAQSGALSASFTSAGATDLSPRSTSSRCAVSRRQPFGCDSASTSCAGDAARERLRRVAPRRLVHDAIDPAEPDRLLQLARDDVIAQVHGRGRAMLNDRRDTCRRRRACHRARWTDRPAGTARRSTRGTRRSRTPCAPAASCRRR